MKAMILAAGYGRRLLPLTKAIPKPLIKINDKAIIVYLIERLANQGFKDIVINISYRREQLQTALGNGQAWGVNITYSIETEALETGGGLTNALPLLGDAPFLAINGDIMTDFPFAELKKSFDSLVHLVLVDSTNSEGKPLKGDFGLKNNQIILTSEKRYTYSGIAVYNPVLFKHCNVEKFSVVPILHECIKNQQASGQLYEGKWEDIGTIERLQKLQGALTR